MVLLAWIGALAWAANTAWGHVVKVNAVPAVSDRPAAGSGRNYVLVGSDSRAGLSAAERKALATGTAEGGRTDTIMLLHIPGNSQKPTLVSLPRDSYVPIRGHGRNKINAAYSFGGAPLLIDTIEQVSGLRVDGYIEIGFGGFAHVVDTVGGVNICVKRHMNDPKAGINLKPGCQLLNGKNALGFVRARYSDPLGDLGRVQRQREFLAALMKKAATPANALLPWRLSSFGSSVASSLTVDKDDSMLEVGKALLAVRSISQGNGQSITMPISNPNLHTAAGDAVKWDSAKALALFKALKNDDPLTVQP
ncbi:LCP family protein [Oryzihumus leptocrescens]|uniref:LCP family protein n=1 Tax=Oryzihumus leptocrescens TaxID=297536 RepID=UPI001FE9B1C6|nr:LCP family protein [Oryzihumus leptocrescens]